MKRHMHRLWTQLQREDEGLLTFEWILLATLIVIGLVGAYSAVRDGLVDELGDVAEAVIRVDQSFHTEAPADLPYAGSWGSWQDDDPAPVVTRGRDLP
ncbi:hypothetical protein [Thermopirellula anaerolimosa]